MKIILITALIASLAGGLLNAQVTITENFEGSTAGIARVCQVPPDTARPLATPVGGSPPVPTTAR